MPKSIRKYGAYTANEDELIREIIDKDETSVLPPLWMRYNVYRNNDPSYSSKFHVPNYYLYRV